MKCLGMKAVHRAVMSFFELLLSCFCFVFRQAKDRLTTTKLGHSVLADMTSSIGKHDFNVASGSGWGSTPQVSAACATRSSSLGLDARLVTDVTAGWAASQQQAKVGTCLSDVFAVAYHILPSHSLTLFSLFLFVPIWFFWSVVIIYLLIFTQLPWCISWCVLGVSLASLTAKPWATSNSCKATVLPWFEHIRTKPGCFFFSRCISFHSQGTCWQTFSCPLLLCTPSCNLIFWFDVFAKCHFCSGPWFQVSTECFSRV